MPQDPPTAIDADCCIIGGGPAGMMAGFLFARAGVRTVVLEKHADFFRDFRGDTVHPSTMTMMKELGLLDEFLGRTHQRLERLFADFGGEVLEVVDLRHLDVPCPFIALMPQWDFLDFLAGHARALPTFTLMLETEGLSLLHDGERVAGVVARGPSGPVEIRARLTIAADGRHSHMRDQAGLAVDDQGAPIDVMWFRLSKRAGGSEREAALFHAGGGGILVTIDRGDYWQCAFVIQKGGAEALKAEGLGRFHERITAVLPALADRVGEIAGWDQVKLLTVTVDRLRRWHRPGLLMIGDAAHAMSPIGGVGINLAVQDAVAAANLLAAKLAAGDLSDDDLAGVAARRLWPVRVTQRIQITVQDRLLAPILREAVAAPTPPWPVRLMSRVRPLQTLAGRILAVGVRPEHIRSPEAVKPLPHAGQSG